MRGLTLNKCISSSQQAHLWVTRARAKSDFASTFLRTTPNLVTERLEEVKSASEAIRREEFDAGAPQT